MLGSQELLGAPNDTIERLGGGTLYSAVAIQKYARQDDHGWSASFTNIVGGDDALLNPDQSTYIEWTFNDSSLINGTVNEDIGFDITFEAVNVPPEPFILTVGGRAKLLPFGSSTGYNSYVRANLVTNHSVVDGQYAYAQAGGDFATYAGYDYYANSGFTVITTEARHDLARSLLAQGPIFRYTVMSLAGGSGGYQYPVQVIQMWIGISALGTRVLTAGDADTRTAFRN